MEGRKIINNSEWVDHVNQSVTRTAYVRGTDYVVASFGSGCNGRDTFHLGDVSNAFMRGKTCKTYTFVGESYREVYALFEKYNNDLDAIFKAFSATDVEDDYGRVDFEGGKLGMTEKKGVNTFSPFHFDRVKPLKKIPKKWNLTSAIKILINNQCKNLRTTNTFTDDYALDAAYAFQQGRIDAIDMAITLIESSSGWWVSGAKEDGDNLGISCHSFDYKDCTVALDGGDHQDDMPNIKPEIVNPESVYTGNVIPFPTVKRAAILM